MSGTKTNKPAAGSTLQLKLSWHSPTLFFVLLLNPLFYVLGALIFRRTMTVKFGLAEEWVQRRRRAIAAGWFITLLGLTITIGGPLILPLELALTGGLLIVLVGLVYGIIRSRVITATRIQDEHVWIRGAHRDFLGRLPPWE